MKSRTESDYMGNIDVPIDALWGAQTQRSLQYFRIGLSLNGSQQFPLSFIHAFAQVKKSTALANHELDILPKELCGFITQACDEIIHGKHDMQFPLAIWQTGSGTHTNMNVNEVIANLANEFAGMPRGERYPVHPNDHVNLSQSSNDLFPTVMNITIVIAMQKNLLPAIDYLMYAIAKKARKFDNTIKIARTHMMDATPITLGQEFSAYQHQLSYIREQLVAIMPAAKTLAIGGGAVGTGLNTPPHWTETVTRQISNVVGIQFSSSDNKIMALAAHDTLTDLHGRLRLLATILFKIASDLRLMASGPRCGLAEVILPANEPGSSSMPGKINPTQIEALTMVAIQVMGNDTAVGLANSQGQFELNVYKPLVFRNVYESVVLLADAISSFSEHCIQGLKVNEPTLSYYVEQSLMLVTTLTPVIGYDKAAQCVNSALEKNISLKQAVLESGFLSETDFDAAMTAGLLKHPAI